MRPTYDFSDLPISVRRGARSGFAVLLDGRDELMLNRAQGKKPRLLQPFPNNSSAPGGQLAHKSLRIVDLGECLQNKARVNAD